MNKELKTFENPYKTKSWSKLSAVNKRKAIAFDVIQQVNLKKIKAKHGDYCDSELYFSRDTRKTLKSMQDSCQVCAMGAMMVTDILNRNSFKGGWGDYQIEKRFEKVFSRFQLRLIETAFEGFVIDTITDKLDNDLPIAIKAIQFGDKYKTPNGILIGIMKNILKDPKGLFLGTDLK